MLKFKNKKPLLVGSIFCNGFKNYQSPNEMWSKLQWEFLTKTSPNFDRVICTVGEMDESIFANSKIVNHSPNPNPAAYADNVRFLMKYFKSQENTYDNFLLIDSDCFPIRPNWYKSLLSFMDKHDKWYASPMRVENLDDWPHMCALFIRGNRIQEDFIDPAPIAYENIYGFKTMEMGPLNKKKVGDSHIWLPLLRSNVWTPHPIKAAIYSNIFYHNASGSRTDLFRAEDALFFNEGIICNDITKQLFDDPQGFIDKLLGKN